MLLDDFGLRCEAGSGVTEERLCVEQGVTAFLLVRFAVAAAVVVGVEELPVDFAQRDEILTPDDKYEMPH